MKETLLDVSLLLAILLKKHPDHQRALGWLAGVKPVLCPIVELGWVRISTKAYGLIIAESLDSLKTLKRKAGFIACDISLEDTSAAPNSGKTTDWYLADLAKKHGMKWATLDKRANHPNAELV